MPMPQMPHQPWMGQGQPQGQQPQQAMPQQPGQPQQGKPGGQKKQTPQQIHAQLDAREKQLKEELKKIQAVRTLMPQGQASAGGQPQQPQGPRPPGR